ncbi:hypothetical protein [Leucobacter luti]|uniref:hypothetical protein n=1 Tax=Leucobacter luti TaxID=340320 RepID=UPI003D035751
MAKVQTPVKGYTGTIVGVHFVDGEGSTDDPQALAYFARQGYKVSGSAATGKPAGGEGGTGDGGTSKADLQARAKELGVSTSGTKGEISERIAEAERAAAADKTDKGDGGDQGDKPADGEGSSVRTVE